MNDTMLPVNSMRCLGEQLPWRLLPQNIFLVIIRCKLVGGIGLPEAKLLFYQLMKNTEIPSRKYLLNADRDPDLGNIRFNVLGERCYIDWLSDSSSHTLNLVHLSEMRIDIVWKTVLLRSLTEVRGLANEGN